MYLVISSPHLIPRRQRIFEESELLHKIQNKRENSRSCEEKYNTNGENIDK
jgi:hypothetical protein